jgi:hypothetical protein
MVAADLLDIASLVAAATFGGTLVVYAHAVYKYDELKLPRFVRMLLWCVFALGLLALLHVWLRFGGAPGVRWVVYALCAVAEMAALFLYTTCPAHVLTRKHDDAMQPFHSAYYGALVLAFLSVLAGAVVEQPGLTLPVRWAVFGGAQLAMVLAARLLSKARVGVAAKMSGGMRYFLYFLLLVSFAYPVLLALSPLLADIISARSAAFGWLLADAVLVFLGGFVLLWSLRKMCGNCELAPPCPPRPPRPPSYTPSCFDCGDDWAGAYGPAPGAPDEEARGVMPEYYPPSAYPVAADAATAPPAPNAVPPLMSSTSTGHAPWGSNAQPPRAAVPPSVAATPSSPYPHLNNYDGQ